MQSRQQIIRTQGVQNNRLVVHLRINFPVPTQKKRVFRNKLHRCNRISTRMSTVSNTGKALAHIKSIWRNFQGFQDQKHRVLHLIISFPVSTHPYEFSSMYSNEYKNADCLKTRENQSYIRKAPSHFYASLRGS